MKQAADFERFGLEDVAFLTGWDCYICDAPTDPNAAPDSLDKAQLEHVVALANGGTHTLENLRIACRWCNAVKGARLTPEQTLQKHLARIVG